MGVELLAYTDRLAGDLPGIRRLLTSGPLAVFDSVHLLPFFTPYDGVDAGFDPVDHGSVDPRLGTWRDLRALVDAGVGVTADLIVNHVSARSAQFLDWLELGTDSAADGMFLTFDTVFPHGASAADITAFYRPRPGLPFTPYRRGDGARLLVWTTFLPDQVDLDVRHPAALDYLERILTTLAAAGVTTVRLDAVGYAVKTAGTDSFLTADTLEFVDLVTARAHEHGLRVLVEVHAHHSQQQEIARHVDLVYDFALPALLLHALGTGDVARLASWLEIRPANAVTVLDTHDGIGIIDAGPAGEQAGLLDHDEMAAIFARAARVTGGESVAASRLPAFAALPHQINATFPSVAGDPTNYVLCRAVQLFVPGHPQIYYVGLLDGRNDLALFARSGEGRDVNRHVYPADELAAALSGDVARAQLELVRLRSTHPAFAGAFTYRTDGARLDLEWRSGEHCARLIADCTPGAVAFTLELSGYPAPITSVAGLAVSRAPA